MIAEKVSQTTTVQHQAASGSFFRKAEDQGFFGAQEAQQFFRAASIQPKLSVSQPGDPQEQEADAVADQVMRAAEPAAPAQATQESEEGTALMRLPNAAETPILSPGDERKEKDLQRKEEIEMDGSLAPQLMRQCAACADEESLQARLMRAAEPGSFSGSPIAFPAAPAQGFDTIQAQSNANIRAGPILARKGRDPPQAQPAFESRLQSTKGTGASMSADTRSFMESRMGADFSQVRIHTDSTAAALSTDIHAQAFTHQGDIYFNAGKFAPDTDSGRHLLAHELTHTVQQGASPVHSRSETPISAKLSRSPASGRAIHRAARERPAPPQLSNAVTRAKSEAGQVNANKEGPDGNRVGWEHLVDYFKTTLGPDKVIPAGGSYAPGAVAEQDIRKKREVSGALPPAHPSVERHGPYVRDAMPSWCGIFAFWALHKAGVPMKPWSLGGRVVTADAAYLPGHIPQAGDIAYRENYSHFALVEKTSGQTVTTVNGNTAGEDNLGGQVQTRDHPLSDWTAFFDPLLLKDGPLSSGETDAASQRPLSLKELRKKLFHVDAKRDEDGPDAAAADSENETLQTKPELSSWSVNAQGSLQGPSAAGGAAQEEVLRKEEAPEETQAMQVQAKCSTHEILSEQAQVEKSATGFLRAENAAPCAAVRTDAFVARRKATQDIQARDIAANKGPPALLQRNLLGDAWDAASDAVGDAYDAASDFAEGALEWAEDQLNEAKEYILGRIRDYVSDVPGYKLLCVILQEDPVTGASVARNGNTLLDAALDVIPVIGAGIRTLLQRTGTWDEAAGFVAGRVDEFVSLVSNIGSRVGSFIDGLGISDIRHPVTVLENFYNLVRGIIEDVVGYVCRSAQAFVDMVKRILITQVAGFVKQHIPRLYPFLRVVFGFDPITNEQVPRNGTQILNALFAVTDEGEEQKRQLLETGAFQRVAAWIDRGIFVFTNLYLAIRSGFSLIWDAVSVDSLLHPIDTFNRIYEHFATPVADVLRWIRDTALFIIEAIKEALLGRLSRWARDQRGYFLITLLIGRDPFTNARVPFSVENVIHAFMSLMDGGEEQFQQMKESGAIDRTTNRIHAAVHRLGFTVAYIVGLFSGLWRSLHLRDLANPFALFRRVYNTLAQPVRRLLAFVVEIVKIVVEVILQIMQFPVDLVRQILTRALAAWDRIKRDPIGFLKNLLRAIRQGFVQFFDHILDHLLFGLTGWLMAELRDAGVPALSDFSLRGVISWVLQVLGVSMEAIWQKLAAHPRIGPEKVARIRGMIGRLEGIWTFIRDVQERGIAAIWERIQEQLSNLWDTVLEAVRNWVMEQIISNITARLLSMLDPTGIMAVINSAIALYRAIQSFLRYLREMLEVVNSFVQGLADIAAGNVATAANYLEATMRRAMPIVIGFLANQVGLRGLGHRVGEMIGRVRAMVDRALTWLVNRAVDTGYALFERLLSMGRSAVRALTNWGQAESRFDTTDGEHHRMYVEERGGVPQLIVASDPMPILSFLSWWESKPGLSTNKRAVIAEARSLYQTRISPLLSQIKASEDAGQPESARASLLRSLLQQNAQLSLKVKEVIGTSANLSGEMQRYGLEGTTGRYNAMPEATGDEFEADHQPQAAVLEYAATLNYFNMPGIHRLRRRAENRAALGWTVNLHEKRHRAGRTYGPAGNATKNAFISRVQAQTNASFTPAQNRTIVVNLLKADLNADVTAMRAVANRPLNDPVWADILALGLPAADAQELYTSIKGRILAAESQVAAQDMNLEN